MFARNRLAALSLFACVMVSCSCDTLEPSGHVRYEVTGTAARIDVGYENSSGSTSEVTNVPVPWSYEWSGVKRDDYLWVYAQIVSAGGGSITVSIKKNGSVYKSETVSGAGARVELSGSY
jgi:hypothetical protein